MAIATELLTAEEFWLRENNKYRELVRGKVVETMPPGGVHGRVAVRLITRLENWSEAGPQGCVGAESGFILARSPDTVRGPDVYYVRAECIPADGVPVAFWNLAPDLAVEIVSPNNTRWQIAARVQDFLAAGTPLVWVIDPEARRVIVHAPDGEPLLLGDDGWLEAPDVLPGFRCSVAELLR